MNPSFLRKMTQVVQGDQIRHRYTNFNIVLLSTKHITTLYEKKRKS